MMRYLIKLLIYIMLIISVLTVMIIQFFSKHYENVFICIVTLLLFGIPMLIDKKLNIKLPSFLEIIILLFIFSGLILGNIQNFYGIFKQWDVILHTVNGFICGAIGFSLISILNHSKMVNNKLSSIFIVLFSICFSMTIGVFWEFFEYGMDVIRDSDMQKDKVVKTISSTILNKEGENVPVLIKNIDHTVVYSIVDGEVIELIIEGGYLDLGIMDTMEDLIVNFIGAILFSVIGLLYIKDRDKYGFIEHLIPIAKT